MDVANLLFIVLLSCPAAQPNATTLAPGWATKETVPGASKQTMHPCESPFLFVFWQLPLFPFPVLNYFDWLKQPSILPYIPTYCCGIYITRILHHLVADFPVACVRSYFYCTPRVDAEFYLTKPRLQNNLLWCGQGFSLLIIPASGFDYSYNTVSNSVSAG